MFMVYWLLFFRWKITLRIYKRKLKNREHRERERDILIYRERERGIEEE